MLTGRGVAGLTKIGFSDCGLSFASRFIRLKDMFSFLPASCVRRGGFFMLKNKNNLKIIITLALFSAISIILGKFLAIPVGLYMRFSFESLPILLAGMMFGPFSGLTTAIIADLLGCILRGYEINLILTFGSAIIGLLSGTLFRLLKRHKTAIAIFVSIFSSHIIGSVIIKSFGLSLWYSLDFKVVLIYRIINYIIVALADFIVILFLFKNKGFQKQINKLTGETNEL